MRESERAEHGYVLVLTLVSLVILTLMMTGMFYRSQADAASSIADRDSTVGFYLAEAGLNYVTWALYHNPKDSLAKNNISLDGDTVPDNQEMLNDPDQVANHTLGYFDIKNTMNYDPQTPQGYVLSNLSMPPHVALDIKVNAQNVPTVVVEPWNNGTSTPSGNGVVLWVVPTVLDPYGDPNKEKDIGSTKNSYDLAAYCVAYVRGRPTQIIRAKIGTMILGFPSNIGATTNSYQ